MKEKLMHILRDCSAQRKDFRAAADGISEILAEELAAEVGKDVILLPILRAGLALLPPFMRIFPDAPVGFLGAARDEETANAHIYYENIPTIELGTKVLILDPMIATGGTAELAIQRCGQPKENIYLVGVLAAPEGLARVKGVNVHVVTIDEGLDDQKFIVPGLGDFGDRYF